MTGRSVAVLDRFPCHLALSDPGKRFGSVVESLTADLDVLARQIGDVRTAHRIDDTRTSLDLRRLAALHGLVAAALHLVDLRHDTLAAADPDDLALVSVLTNLVVGDLEGLDPAVRRDGLAAAVGFDERLASERRVVHATIAAHRVGNGTAAAILTAAAGYLGFALDPTSVTHHADRWWHLAPAVDGLVDGIGGAGPVADLFALEENPHQDASVSPAPRRHGDRFRIRRGGLEDVVTSVVVFGTGDRTVAPMVVNVDAGRGVVFDGLVPDGAELVVAAHGRASLDGVDVTGRALVFSGGMFADATASHPNDHRFAAADGSDAGDDLRAATFVETAPIADGFDQRPSLPHGGSVAGLPLPLGESRWSFFVRLAHAGSGERAAVARNAAGRFDESVFADREGPPVEPSGSIGFRWEEREPFAARVVLPQRLAVLDDEHGTVVREPLRQLLDRHRAAGVHLSVTYADPRWTVGEGVARDPGSTDPLGTVVAGTTLWPDDTPQPVPA